MGIKLSNASFAVVGKMISVLLVSLSAFVMPLQAQPTPVANDYKHTLHGGGTDENKVVFLILGDGFTSSSADQTKFLKKAQETSDQIINKQYPFTLFKDGINIYAVETHSESNANGYFGFIKNGSLVSGYGTQANIAAVVNKHAPTTVVVMIYGNHTSSSGFGTLSNISGTSCRAGVAGMGAHVLVMMHEVGHSVGDLWDEYCSGTQGFGDGSKANTSKDSNPNTMKWRAWLGISYSEGDTWGTIGINGVSNANCQGVYIPSAYYNGGKATVCLMQGGAANAPPFCRVCSSELTRRLADKTKEMYQAKSDIEEANVPASQTRIVDAAFHGCYKLKTVNIPASISSIGDYAFLRCTTLTTVTNSATTPQTIDSTVFYGVNTSKVTLRVPNGSVAAYRAADIWKDFNIVSISGGEQPPIPANCIITATKTDGGDVFVSGTPLSAYYDGEIEVVGHGSLTLSFFTFDGMQLSDVLIDGQSNPDAVAAGEYTFSDVVSNHTIHVVFKRGDHTSIKPEKSNKCFGIRFVQNVVSDKAQMSVILPNGEKVAETKFVIYDNAGNVVFSETVRGEKSEWNLTNAAGRIVASGAYLVVAEIKEKNGKVYAYSAKLAVKR